MKESNTSNQNSEPKEQVIIFKENQKKDGTFVGEIKLNSPKTLNALNTEMIFSARDQVESWAQNPKCSLLFLHGAGEKAFCAGGDIKVMHNSIKEAKEKGEDAGLSIKNFFDKEYQLIELLRTFPKPVVAWGGGVVMGGGLGLLMGSSHRVVTETSLFAMPEIHIGLFPDVGGTYFLSRLPHYWGWYLAITAHRISPQEALLIQFGNLYFKNSQKEEVFQFLLNGSFKNEDDLLKQLQTLQAKREFPKPSFLEVYKQDIQKLCESKDIKTIHKNFKSFVLGESEYSKIVEKDKLNFSRGSPSSLGIVCEQLKRGDGMDLKNVFKMELILAQACARRFDFQEGIRALLIDKTRDANWNPAQVEELTEPWIKEHFEFIS